MCEICDETELAFNTTVPGDRRPTSQRRPIDRLRAASLTLLDRIAVCGEFAGVESGFCGDMTPPKHETVRVFSVCQRMQLDGLRIKHKVLSYFTTDMSVSIDKSTVHSVVHWMQSYST